MSTGEETIETIDIWISIIAATIPILYIIRYYFQGKQFSKRVPLNGVTIIVTGCSSGIGKETIYALAKRGAKIFMACRDYDKTEEIRLDIMRKTGNYNLINSPLDLASFQSIRDFVKRFLDTEDHLNILINNAGVGGITERTLTKDGLELTIGVNHFGHFLLTNLLLDILKKSAPSRIVNVSSLAHKWTNIDVNNLNSEKYYDKWSAYNQSKLANILFTMELAKRLRETGVTANSLHPGAVNTHLIRHQPILIKLIFYLIYIFLKTPKSGTQTTLAVALDPNLKNVSGKFFSDCKIIQESNAAKDNIISEWLWNVSEKVTNLNV